jgi:hypothetical protein
MQGFIGGRAPSRGRFPAEITGGLSPRSVKGGSGGTFNHLGAVGDLLTSRNSCMREAGARHREMMFPRTLPGSLGVPPLLVELT